MTKYEMAENRSIIMGGIVKRVLRNTNGPDKNVIEQRVGTKIEF
jgi:hypothetical protein